MTFSIFSSFTKYSSINKMHGSRKKEKDHLLSLYNIDVMGSTKKYNSNSILTNWVAKEREHEKYTIRYLLFKFFVYKHSYGYKHK